MFRDPSGYYKLFRVSPDASMVEIKQAYRRLAQKLHPDKSTLPNSVEIFQHIAEIYSILMNEEKRRRYDTCWQPEGASTHVTRGSVTRGTTPAFDTYNKAAMRSAGARGFR